MLSPLYFTELYHRIRHRSSSTLSAFIYLSGRRFILAFSMAFSYGKYYEPFYLVRNSFRTYKLKTVELNFKSMMYGTMVRLKIKLCGKGSSAEVVQKYSGIMSHTRKEIWLRN